MKTRLAALSIMVALAGCSQQDGMGTGKLKTASQDSTGQGSQAASILRTIARQPNQSIGNAPDRGELFAYQEAGVKQEGAYTMRPLQLSEEHALRGIVTGLMTVPAPDGSEIKIRYERHEENPDGNWSWIGRVVGGDAAQEAIFTFGEKAVFASIPQLAGPALRITTQKGVAYLVQADPSKLFKAKGMGSDAKVASSSNVAGALEPNDPLANMAMAKARSAAADATEKSISAGSTIDLVAGYSQGLATALGSDSAAVTRLNAIVVSANQALLNSKVNARIRLVFALKVAYADNTDNGVALEQLTGFNDGGAAVTIPAALVPLRTARETYGADLVTLVRDLQEVQAGCGIAWLVGAEGTQIVPAQDAPYGYSIVSDGDYNDANSNTYFCDDITLAHELAHNMGSAHDIENARDDSGVLVPGRYPYSYGQKTTAAAGNFYTVMAYGGDNQTLYRVFSNPNITICGGRACGAANAADNARSLGQTVPIVSQFRATKVPLVGAARNDVDADGRSDVLLQNATTRQFSYRIANGTAVTRSQLINGVGAGYTVAATGDFNADGRADLIYTSSNLDLYMWIGNGTTFTSTKVGVYPAGWKVVGAADVDGDNKSDLLLHNATTNQFSYRIMNGTATVRSALLNVGAGYTVGAIGDFNGDGKADLIWTSSNLDLYLWTGNGTTFTSAAIGNYPSGWKLVGAGDIDADGKSDLILHNATTRQLSYRIMNGGTTTRSALISGVGAGYTVGTTGDFNGDGKTDLVWTSANLDLYMWIGNGTGFTSTKFGVYPSGWKVVY